MGPNSLTKTIYCHYSGVPLGQLTIMIAEGHLAYMQSHSEAIYLHPFYHLSPAVLLRKLEDSLLHAKSVEWKLEEQQQTRLTLLVSALMHSMHVLKQDTSSLPSLPIAAASASRLFELAKWFHFSATKRIELPIYSVCKNNENLDWNNFKYWLDTAFEARDSLTTQARQLQIEATKRAQEESLKELKFEVYRRVDMQKVWNWIELQLADSYSQGRLITFKQLFLNGDLAIEDWVMDDVDDLREAIFTCCDMGNGIMHFVQKRLNSIGSLIRDFYGSFTLLSQVKDESEDEVSQTLEEAEFIGGFDARVQNLETLPEPPDRKHFATLGLYLKAQAQYNILARRFSLMKAREGTKS